MPCLTSQPTEDPGSTTTEGPVLVEGTCSVLAEAGSVGELEVTEAEAIVESSPAIRAGGWGDGRENE